MKIRLCSCIVDINFVSPQLLYSFTLKAAQTGHEADGAEQSCLTASSSTSSPGDDDITLCLCPELKQVLQELLVERQKLQDTKNKCTQTLQRLQRKQDELDRKQDEVQKKKDELAALRQEVEACRQEVASSLKDVNHQRAALQVIMNH